MKLTNKQKGMIFMAPTVIFFGIVLIGAAYITITQISKQMSIQNIVSAVVALFMVITFIIGSVLYEKKDD